MGYPEDPPVCECCQEEFILRDFDSEPSRYCDECAHDAVEHLRVQLYERAVALDETAEELGRSELRYRLDIGSDVNELKGKISELSARLRTLRDFVAELAEDGCSYGDGCEDWEPAPRQCVGRDDEGITVSDLGFFEWCEECLGCGTYIYEPEGVDWPCLCESDAHWHPCSGGAGCDAIPNEDRIGDLILAGHYWLGKGIWWCIPPGKRHWNGDTRPCAGEGD